MDVALVFGANPGPLGLPYRPLLSQNPPPAPGIMDVILQFWKLNIHISCTLWAGRHCGHAVRALTSINTNSLSGRRPLGLQCQALHITRCIWIKSKIKINQLQLQIKTLPSQQNTGNEAARWRVELLRTGHVTLSRRPKNKRFQE